MKEIRCPCCRTDARPGQLLLKADRVKGEIKCPRRGAIIQLNYPKAEPIASSGRQDG